MNDHNDVPEGRDIIIWSCIAVAAIIVGVLLAVIF